MIVGYSINRNQQREPEKNDTPPIPLMTYSVYGEIYCYSRIFVLDSIIWINVNIV